MEDIRSRLIRFLEEELGCMEIKNNDALYLLVDDCELQNLNDFVTRELDIDYVITERNLLEMTFGQYLKKLKEVHKKSNDQKVLVS